MIAVFATLIFALGASLEVRVAPDKDLPLAYAGEPLIVELRSATQMRIEGTLTLSGAAMSEHAVGPLTLWPDEAQWVILEDAAQARGVYDAVLTMHRHEPWRGRMARVERPRPFPDGPIVLVLPADAGAIPAALRHLTVERVSMPWTSTQGAARRSALLDAGYAVDVRGADVDAMQQTFGESEGRTVGSWTVDAAALPDVLGRAELRPLRVGWTVAQPGELTAGLAQAAPHRPAQVTVGAAADPALTPTTLRDEAARVGYEGIAVGAVLPESAPIAQGIILALAEGYASVGVGYEAVTEAGMPNEAFVVVGALNRRLASARYVGPTALNEAATGHLFHNVTDGHWSLWMWADGNQPAELSIGDATDLAVLDTAGNARALGDVRDGRLALSLGVEPLCLRGRGGGVVAAAAAARVHARAQALAEFAAALGEEAPGIGEIATALLDTTDATANRFAFFGLVRSLRELESDWITGALPVDVAGPCVVQVAGLTRDLAILEEQIGAPFLEPLHETIARCTEFLEQFSAAGVAPSQRTAWLSEEVARLMQEAGTLNASGRGIEADAVAALAEWRARALLEHAEDRTPQEAVVEDEIDVHAEDAEAE